MRRIMFAHESAPHIQPALGLMAPDTPSLHLDTVEGRVWLQLEWRALAAALVQTGPAQTRAIRDALLVHVQRLLPPPKWGGPTPAYRRERGWGIA